MSESIKRIAIVGGGAGGMFAAIAAANRVRELQLPIEVHLFERNPRCGIKILISGGGKCNITHDGPIEDVLRLGFPQKNEQRFLKHAMYRYSNQEVLRLLEKHNVEWYARDNGRIFPTSSRAEDVLYAFESEMRSLPIRLHTRSRIEAIERIVDDAPTPGPSPEERGDFLNWRIRMGGEWSDFDALTLATGGTSYQKVGTTGDGIRFAQSIGHTIVPVRAALAPIYLWRPPPQDLGGVALRDAVLYVVRDNSILSTAAGDILLTHKGLSGPATLDISREAALVMEQGPIRMQSRLIESGIDVPKHLLDIASARPQQQVKTWLEEILPNRFVPIVMTQAATPLERKWNALTKTERNDLAKTLERFDFGEVREIPIDRGEVTAGGVSLSEVDAKTMMSRMHPGLFFVGEMLDIAGEIGGYNLQAAYSTGWVAGEEAVALVNRNI